MCWRSAALFAILWSLVRDPELVGTCSRGCSAWARRSRSPDYGLVRSRGGCAAAWASHGATDSPTCRAAARGSVVQIVAFGLGLMVLLLLAVVRGDLLADWRRSLPVDVPNNFLINIRPRGARAARTSS